MKISLKQLTNKIFNKHEPKTYRLPLDGANAFVFSVKESGKFITVSGWSYIPQKFENNDTVILTDRDGDHTYKIKDIRYMTDPKDQYFMECEFIGKQSS